MPWESCTIITADCPSSWKHGINQLQLKWFKIYPQLPICAIGIFDKLPTVLAWSLKWPICITLFLPNMIFLLKLFISYNSPWTGKVLHIDYNATLQYHASAVLSVSLTWPHYKISLCSLCFWSSVSLQLVSRQLLNLWIYPFFCRASSSLPREAV